MFSKVYSVPSMLASLLLCLSTTSHAQVTILDLQKASPVYNEWGIVTGANFQQLSASPFVAKYSNGGVAGVYLKHHNRFSALEVGLALTTATFTTEATDKFKRQDLNVVYANIPFAVSVKTSKRWSLQMGATYQYLVTTQNNTTPKDNTFDEKKLFKPSNVYLTVGIDYTIASGLNLGANYGIGMLDINNQKYGSYTETWMTSGAQVTLKCRMKKFYRKFE